jgi:hypothetical protein
MLGSATEESVELAMAWSAALRVIVAFTQSPTDLPSRMSSKAIELSCGQIAQMSSALTRLAVDVFDGEGFMVWQRRQ